VKSAAKRGLAALLGQVFIPSTLQAMA